MTQVPRRPGRRSPPRSTPKPGAAAEKQGLHPRNRHRERYDFPALIQASPELARFVARNPYGDDSIDFADPEAVRALNRALLACFYGVSAWHIPPHYLCPPVPGRADYLHYAADLLGNCNAGVIPSGPAVHVLDVGVGANCIYPILGVREYGWRFLGSDIDALALACASGIVQDNPGLGLAIELRLQASPGQIFQGLLRSDEVFDLSVCNPPFHASLAQAHEGTQRKWRNLGRGQDGAPRLNFGGQGAELWCPGGESGFITRMILESAQIPTQILWFSTLVSKSAALPELQHALRTAGALEVRILAMSQGQKQSRVLAWTFQNADQQRQWAAARWASSNRPHPSNSPPAKAQS